VILPVIKTVIQTVILLLMLATPLRAAPLSGQEVSDLILQALADAGQGGTPVLSLHRGFPPCTTPPDITPGKAGWSAVDVTCPDIQGWTRRVRINGGQPVARAPRTAAADSLVTKAIVLTDSLPKGTVLSRDHLTTGTVPGIGQDGQITDLTSALGRRLKVNLGAGQAVLARHLDHDWLVREGSPVTILIETGPILIETGGIALQSGQLGEAIQVSNARSGRALHVTVIGPNKTKVRPNIR
jgi:flagella basal body P-ring formation protein FlgA